MVTTTQVVEVLPSIASALAAAGSFFVAILVHCHSRQAEKSRATNEIWRLAADIEAEAMRIELIAPQTQIAYGNLAGLSGAVGGSRQQVYQRALEFNLRETRDIVNNVREEMQCLSSKRARVSRDDLEKMQVNMWQQLQMLRVTSEKLNREYANLREQILVHYHKQVGTPA